MPVAFDTLHSQSLVLSNDFKTTGVALWPELAVQLALLRERGYLTYFDGMTVVERLVTVVASGDAPFDTILANQSYLDIFYDAPLDRLSDLSLEWPDPSHVPEADKAARSAMSFSSPVAGLRPVGNPKYEDGPLLVQQIPRPSRMALAGRILISSQLTSVEMSALFRARALASRNCRSCVPRSAARTEEA